MEWRIDLKLTPNSEFAEVGTWTPSESVAAALADTTAGWLGAMVSAMLPLGPYPAEIRLVRIH